MSKLTRILSIDGGGIRGILPGQILVSLEKKLQQKTGNPQARLAHYFDMFAGTSTGGILTCLYLCPDDASPSAPRFSAQEAVNLYLLNGGEIFKSSVTRKVLSAGGMADEKYSAQSLENCLNTYFGDIRLSQLIKPCFITSYNIFNRSTHFFTQHDAKEKEGYDYYLREVARATAAAPTYFEPALVRSMSEVSYPLVDGGIFANNPAMCAYAEARDLFYSANDKDVKPEMFVLSIGTGTIKKQYEYKKAKDWGALGWVSPLIDMMMSGVSETVDYQLRKLFEAFGKPHNYVRITPELGMAAPEMDDASPQNLAALKEAGTMSAEKYDSVLDDVVERLLQNNNHGNIMADNSVLSKQTQNT